MIAVLEPDGERAGGMEQAFDELGLSAFALFFDSAPQLVAWLRENLKRTALISLGHQPGASAPDFDPGRGRDVVTWLAAQPPACAVVLHGDGDPERGVLRELLETAGWTVEAVAGADLTTWARRIWDLYGAVV
jgi:hypothetical protein